MVKNSNNEAQWNYFEFSIEKKFKDENNDIARNKLWNSVNQATNL